MRTVSLRLADLEKVSIPIGFVGENLFTRVIIDCKKHFDEHPNDYVGLVVNPPMGEKYPAIVVRDGDNVIWDVTASDLINKGRGEIQLSFTDGTHIGKSYKGQIKINDSIEPSGEVPEPIENFIERASEILSEVEEVIPAGGTIGQVLTKKSDEDYDTEWTDSAGGGTNNYEKLYNKPQIGGVTLIGDKSLHDFGIAAEEDIPDISGKTDKVQGATSGNFAGLDANGNLTDSGKKASDFATPADVNAKYTKPVNGIPETDIEDGAITEAKLNDSLKGALAWQTDVDGLMSAITQEKAPVILDTASGSIVTIPDGADGMKVETLTVAIEPVQSGSGDPSPDNVRPISGWTGANVERTGKNLFDKVNFGVLNAYISLGTVYSSTNHKTVYIPCKPNTTYTLSNVATNRNLLWYSSEIPSLGDSNLLGGTSTVTTDATAKYLVAYVWNQNSDTATFNETLDAIQIEIGSSVSAYEPYSGQTKTYPFPSQAGTVYGATLTVNSDGTGKLTLDRIGKVFRESDVYTVVSGAAIVQFGSDKVLASYSASAGDKAKMIHSHYKLDTAHGGWDAVEENCFIVAGSYYWGTKFSGTIAEYKAFLEAQYSAGTPVSCVAVLQTPITYNLTALEVISMLKVTNIWADTGETSIVYPADTKLYIDKKLTASQTLMELIVTANREEAMKATKAYTTGNLLIVNGTLYRATTSIANGATLTVGTNVTATNIATELANLA